MNSPRLLPAGAVTAWLLAGAAGFALAALLVFAQPSAASAPTCLLQRLAHVPCPTCGLTHATAALLRGHLRESLAWHPLAPALVPQAVLAWGWWGGVLLGRLRPPGERLACWVLSLDAIALLAAWAVRLRG